MEQTKHGTLAESCATCHDRDQAIKHSKDRAEGTETPGPSVKAWTATFVSTMRDDLRRACRKVGFKFVALDLGGLQSGSVSLPLVAS